MRIKTSLALLICWVFSGIPTLSAQNINIVSTQIDIEQETNNSEVVSESLYLKNNASSKYQFSLKELGANYPFNLRGVDGSDSIEFSVRADEFITEASLNLIYSYSPALLADYSHINLLINDEVALSLPVPKESAGQSLQEFISLPLHLFGENNRIRLQLIGHYTLDCEDPLHSSLWANISNLSQLIIKTESVILPNDLSLLPAPFYDKKDFRDFRLPFVFTEKVDENVLAAAGTVSSWLGQLAGTKKGSYPVSYQSNYPDQGNAIVFTTSRYLKDSGLDLETLNGPTLSVQPNPNDPYGKLLYIVGRNTDELKQAARALVLGAETFSGQTAQVSQLAQLKPRQPYDAPNWMPSNQTTTLGELAPKTHFSVNGYDPAPIKIPLRVAPDLFTWRAQPVRLDLTYRYTPQIGETNSALLMNTDSKFLRSLPLFSTSQLKNRDWLDQLVQGDMLPVKTTINIPLQRLVPQTELQFKFLYNYIKEGECKDVIVDNVRGYIDPDSSINMPDYPHFIEMPDLNAFSVSGFPFTRMADLSETVVILSASPSAEEISAYLSILGHLGSITGYPAVGLQVGLGQLGLDKDKDALILAVGSPPWLESMSESLPALVAGQDKRFTISDLIYKENNWLNYNSNDLTQQPTTDISYQSDGTQAFFAGLESPHTAQRSLVVLASSDVEGLDQAVQILLKNPNQLTGTLAIVKQNSIEPLVFEPTYYVGHLPWMKRLEWEIAKYWPGVPPIRYLLITLGVILVLISLLWGRRIVKNRSLRKIKET